MLCSFTIYKGNQKDEVYIQKIYVEFVIPT